MNKLGDAIHFRLGKTDADGNNELQGVFFMIRKRMVCREAAEAVYEAESILAEDMDEELFGDGRNIVRELCTLLEALANGMIADSGIAGDVTKMSKELIEADVPKILKERVEKALESKFMKGGYE